MCSRLTLTGGRLPKCVAWCWSQIILERVQEWANKLVHRESMRESFCHVSRTALRQQRCSSSNDLPEHIVVMWRAVLNNAWRVCVLEQGARCWRPEKVSCTAEEMIGALRLWNQGLMTTVQSRSSRTNKTPSSPVCREQVCIQMCPVWSWSIYLSYHIIS